MSSALEQEDEAGPSESTISGTHTKSVNLGWSLCMAGLSFCFSCETVIYLLVMLFMG